MSLPDGIIRERTWIYGCTDNPFVGLDGSFQYAENLNVFDDPRGIKLTTGWSKTTSKKSSILVSAGDYLIRIPKTGGTVEKIDPDSRPNGTSLGTLQNFTPYDAVIFNGSCWVITRIQSLGQTALCEFPLDGSGIKSHLPIDNTGDTQIIMGDQTPAYCNCICNFNNSMLLVGNGNYLWLYNPAEDLKTSTATGWKIVKTYSTESEIVDISPKADYVEMFISDGYGNTKIHYYPGIYDMEDSGLTKSIELPNTRIQRVYPHMTKEMVVLSLDGSNNNVSLREVIGYDTYPVMRNHRAGLSSYDVQHKLGFFTGPCSTDMAWYDGRAYVADVEGIWEFNWYDEDKLPVGNLRWKFNDEDDDQTPFGLAIAKDYVFVSYDDGEYKCRIYDTANPYGYAEEGTLISRAIETEYGGEFTKQLTSWLVQYEMNNLTSNNGSIEIYACGNRAWNSINDSKRIKIAEITQDDAEFYGSVSSGYNIGTCTKTFDQAGDYSFMQDRQIIEYKVVIKRGDEEDASPVLRSILMNYDIKEKTNYFS